ncbi:hypothetical protein DASC09_055570 [Saccharomycopsis crataegensis]|uniref:Protein kinase domain-containing protein n=1 Tax=Saccharomycopsis crataegensis TaxID=43959 RepID=A0AAV5QVS6_9ASCO|nr:hypothetical protein DASC09_055570 [Saccharomycopsis crataegensis]
MEGQFILLENLVESGYVSLHEFHEPENFRKDRLLRNMLLMMSEVHCAGVAHCNIKGRNIFINESMKIKLINFGSSTRMKPRPFKPKRAQSPLLATLKDGFQDDYSRLFDLLDKKFPAHRTCEQILKQFIDGTERLRYFLGVKIFYFGFVIEMMVERDIQSVDCNGAFKNLSEVLALIEIHD